MEKVEAKVEIAPDAKVEPSLETGTESLETHRKLMKFFEDNKAEYIVRTHAASKTAEEAAINRGTPLCSGAKSMLVKDNSKSSVKDLYYLAVLSASRRFLWQPLRKLAGVKNIRFATKEEAVAKTGCLPGAIPPFGSIFGVKTYLDESLLKQGEVINFTAGLRTCSIQMTAKQYLDLEKPVAIGSFSDEGEPTTKP